MNLTEAIESKSRAFAADIAELVREHLLGALAAPALRHEGAARAFRAVERRAIRADAAMRRQKPKPGEKRAPEAIDALGDRFVAYVGRNPGQRIEQIALGMGITTRELALPARKAIEDGAITTEGVKRATRYHLAKAVSRA
jgi:hypothetical protein